MAMSLAKKLQLKPDTRLAVLHAPEGYLGQLEDVPAGVQITEALDGNVNAVQLFAKNQADLDRNVPAILDTLDEDALLWISYPKKSAKVGTDLSRDEGWDILNQAGLTGIRLISIDDVWSSMRFRPVHLVNSKRTQE